MAESGNRNSYRDNAYRKLKKTEPYGFVKNMKFFKDRAFKDKRLTPMPKLLLAYMIMHCDQNGVCFISISKLAIEEDTTRQAIQNRLLPLLRYGYIVREECFSKNGRQKQNTYRLNLSLLDTSDYPELTEASCTPATSESCPSAISEDCIPATSESCTKKPFKIPDKNYSDFDLNRFLKEVREIAFEDLEPLQRANATNEIRNKAQSIQDEINLHIEYGIDRGIPVHRFDKFL